MLNYSYKYLISQLMQAWSRKSTYNRCSFSTFPSRRPFSFTSSSASFSVLRTTNWHNLRNQPVISTENHCYLQHLHRYSLFRLFHINVSVQTKHHEGETGIFKDLMNFLGLFLSLSSSLQQFKLYI